MAFSKSFPKTKDKYPVWVEISLTEEEERQTEQEAREENKKIMRECLDDAKSIAPDSDVARIAVALFEKRASHVVYWKERKCRDKFEKLHSQKTLD